MDEKPQTWFSGSFPGLYKCMPKHKLLVHLAGSGDEPHNHVLSGCPSIVISVADSTPRVLLLQPLAECQEFLHQRTTTTSYLAFLVGLLIRTTRRFKLSSSLQAYVLPNVSINQIVLPNDAKAQLMTSSRLWVSTQFQLLTRHNGLINKARPKRRKPSSVTTSHQAVQLINCPVSSKP